MSRTLQIACLATALLFVAFVGGRVEGVVLPVVSPARIVTAEPVAGGTWTRVTGTVQRRRDCRFVDLEWRVGTRRSYAVVDKVYERSGQMRAGSVYHFGPWRLQLTPDQLHNRSRAIVVHHCHPLWLTRSVFFESQSR